ncbi:hypothetical protein AX14_003437 [Amanita brunnescens Koide BX004]|nr:hypothetical protein AX14_003437 [Amanita brunnescens Koide BX004]
MSIAISRSDEKPKRLFVSAPNGSSTSFSVATVSEEMPVGSDASYKSVALTPDNADSVLDPALDMRKFCQLLSKNPKLLYSPEEDLHRPKSMSLIPRRFVLERSSKTLGMDYTGTLKFDNNHGLKTHLNLSKGSGAHCLVDQYILAAVIYAQSILDSDEMLKHEMDRKHKVSDPHIAVFPELQIPLTTVTCGNNSYAFRGVLDHGIGFMSDAEQTALANGGGSASS